METSPKENRLLAVVWLVLAVAVAATGLYGLFTPGKYFIASFFSLSLILGCVARQRTQKYKMEPASFRGTIRNLSIFLIFSAAIGGAASANV